MANLLRSTSLDEIEMAVLIHLVFALQGGPFVCISLFTDPDSVSHRLEQVLKIKLSRFCEMRIPNQSIPLKHVGAIIQ